MYTALVFVAGVLFCIGVSALAVLWEAQVEIKAKKIADERGMTLKPAQKTYLTNNHFEREPKCRKDQ